MANSHEVIKMQNTEDHASYPSKFMKKNHSTHIKWQKKTKEDALKMAQKYGFESLSPYLRYLSSEGFAEMLLMVMEIHKELMKGKVSKVDPSMLELRDKVVSSNDNNKPKKNQIVVTSNEIEHLDTPTLMENEILIES